MSSDNRAGGIGILGMTFVVFLVLKLVGAIGWSWWWVTAPLWGGYMIIITVTAFLAMVGAIGWLAIKAVMR